MTTQTNTQHYAIVQRSSDRVLVAGESAAEAIAEYNGINDNGEATTALKTSWYSSQDIVLVACTQFLFTKALAGDDLDYFWNDLTKQLDCYITEIEDFDRSDSTLSSEYDETSDYTTFNSYSEPVFDFKEYLLETSKSYDSLLDYDDVSDITNDIEAHFNNERASEYDTVVYALCTESNQYPAGPFKLDGEERYCMKFCRSNVVLILRKS